jgi:hypothetical protein
MRLEPLELWLDLPETGNLLPQLREALQLHVGDSVQLLRWAITAVDSSVAGSRRLRIEAVLLHRDEQ